LIESQGVVVYDMIGYMIVMHKLLTKHFLSVLVRRSSTTSMYDGAAAAGRRSGENTTGDVDPTPTLSRSTGIPRCGVDARSTPTKIKRTSKKGTDTVGNRRVCKERRKLRCRDDGVESSIPLEPFRWCHTNYLEFENERC
jgi:hypothetical protein